MNPGAHVTCTIRLRRPRDAILIPISLHRESHLHRSARNPIRISANAERDLHAFFIMLVTFGGDSLEMEMNCAQFR